MTPWSRSGSDESTATTETPFRWSTALTRAEQLLEVDVADVSRVVVAGNDDEVLAVEPVEVALGLGVLLLEAEGREVAGADDDVRLELVDLHDRPLGRLGTKYGDPQWRSEIWAIRKSRGSHRSVRRSVVLGRPG